MEGEGEGGALNQYILHGEGMDIFWNNTMQLTSGGVELSESGDTSLTWGVPLLEGGYDEGRPMGMGVWLQLDELKGNWIKKVT